MKLLWQSGKFLLFDMAGTLFFLALYSLTRNLTLGVAVGIAVTATQIGLELARRRPVDTMQWVSLALVISSGLGALIAHDPRIVLVKPTVIYLIIGAVMLKPGWQNRYLPPVAKQWVGDLAGRFGYAWAALMFFSGALSLALAFTVSLGSWLLLMSIWATASKIALFAIEFTTLRIIGRSRRLRGETPSGATAATA